MNTVQPFVLLLLRRLYRRQLATLVSLFAIAPGCGSEASDCELTATCLGDGLDGGEPDESDGDDVDDAPEPAASPGSAMPPEFGSGLDLGPRSAADAGELDETRSSTSDAGSAETSDTGRDAGTNGGDGDAAVIPDVADDAPVIPGSDAGASVDAGEPHDEPSPEPAPEYSVGGEVVGLKGTLIFELGGEQFVMPQDGSFSVGGFLENSSYMIEFVRQPDGEVCSTPSPNGLVQGGDVSVVITCVSDIASLSEVGVEGAELVPEFDPNVSEYSIEVGLFTQSLRLSAVVSDPDAELSASGVPIESGATRVVPIALGSNAASFEVVAVSGRVQIYSIEVTRRSSIVAAPRELLSPRADGIEGFGNRVSVSGDFMFVDGANTLASGGPQGFLFQRIGESWEYATTVEDLISDPVHEIRDGAVCGNTLGVVAVPTNGSATESLYVLSRASGSWSFQGAFTGLAPSTDMACDDDLIAVRTSSGTQLFVSDGSGFTAGPLLPTPSDLGSDSRGRLALDDGILVVGAFNDSSAATGINGDPASNCMAGINCAPSSGAAYVFEQNQLGQWQQAAYIKASNATTQALFGWAVGIEGNTLVVGAPREDAAFVGVSDTAPVYDCAATPSACRSNTGAVYVYERGESGWEETAFLKHSQIELSEEFGSPVALFGDLLFVGTEYSSAAAPSGGAGYLFARDGDTWTELPVELVPPDAVVDDYFPHRAVLNEHGLFGSAVTRSSGQDKVFWFSE